MSAFVIALIAHCSLYPAMPRTEGATWQMNDITARVFEAGIELECE